MSYKRERELIQTLIIEGYVGIDELGKIDRAAAFELLASGIADFDADRTHLELNSLAEEVITGLAASKHYLSDTGIREANETIIPHLIEIGAIVRQSFGAYGLQNRLQTAALELI